METPRSGFSMRMQNRSWRRLRRVHDTLRMTRGIGASSVCHGHLGRAGSHINSRPCHTCQILKNTSPAQAPARIFSNPVPIADTSASISTSVIGVESVAVQVLIITNPSSNR